MQRASAVTLRGASLADGGRRARNHAWLPPPSRLRHRPRAASARSIRRHVVWNASITALGGLLFGFADALHMTEDDVRVVVDLTRATEETDG